MKEIKEMTQQELLEYCVKLKLNGASFREFHSLFQQHEVDEETVKFVMRSLNEIDQKQRVVAQQQSKVNQTAGGIKSLVLGLILLVFAFVLYSYTSNLGKIFIFNIVVAALGSLLVLRGCVNLIMRISNSK